MNVYDAEKRNDVLVAQEFDFTVEQMDALPVEVVESIDDLVVTNINVARCN